MQSDVLPYTFYDSMSYETVQNTEPPSGFERRDSPSVQMQGQRPKANQLEMPMRDLPMPPPSTPSVMPPTPPQQQPVQQQPAEQIAEEDIRLDVQKIDTKLPDISNYNVMKDLLYIFIAVLTIDVVVIFLVRFFPEVFGSPINRWYDFFGLNAVIADVGIIFIGFILARYMYTTFIKNKYAEGKWSPLWFTGTSVVVQLLHDLAFYFGIITQVPRGHNAMMDVFKDYAASGGAKILGADSLMMIGSSLVAMVLKGQSNFVVSSFAALVSYALPYILYTRNQYSATAGLKY